MPTGYTSELAEGEQDVRTFVLRCARAMGACVMQRDEPMDAEPRLMDPEKDSYHLKKIESLEKELNELELSTPNQLEAKRLAFVVSQKVATKDRVLKVKQQHARYYRMLADIRQIHGLPEGLGKFMSEQIHTSMKYDCPQDILDADPDTYVDPWDKEPPANTQDWYDREKTRIHKDLGYHNEEYAKERERTKERNAWIKQLYKALDDAGYGS